MEAGRAWRWFLQRITGLIIAIGMIIHFLILHFIDPFIRTPQVSLRLKSIGWRSFYIFLLGALLYHALNGIWEIIIDYEPSWSREAKMITSWLLILIGICSFCFGVWIIKGFF